MRVLLAGAGIGGLTAALALARRGIGATVIEASASLGEVGAGLQLSPNATHVLFALGLEAPLRAIAFAPEAAEVHDRRSGRRLLRTELGAAAEARWGAPYLQVHRADLHALLVEATQEACVDLHLGTRLTGLSQDEGGVKAQVERVDGVQTLRADVLIGCDGIRSVVRANLWGEEAARYTGQMAWRALAPAERLPPGLVAPAAMVWAGQGRHFVHYPVRAGGLINLVGVVAQREAPRESWTERGDAAAFAADFVGWPAQVTQLIAAAGPVWRYAIHDRPTLAAWSKQRVSLLGDAAHPAPPFLAQGAGMAIEDAEALARHLTAPSSIEAALQAYEAERRPRTAKVLAWSRRNAHLFHLPSPVAQGVFQMARLVDTLTPEAAARRFDWLYGFRGAQAEPC
ncbi:MAG: FAD-dependent monooxygenase [Caulobacteraceae bacterium]